MRRAPVVIGWRETAAASPTAPLRLLEAPGLALLRQNLPAVRVETNPRPIQLERIARARPAAVLAVFGADGLATALGACTQLAAAGQPPIVVRGRWLGAQHRDDVAAASFDGAMLPWLQELGVPLPQRWLQPMVVAELWHPRHSGVRLGLLCAALPDAGVLDLADLFGGADEGAPPSTLPGSAADDPEIEGDRLLGAYARAGLRGVLVVDNGPGAAALAERAARRGMLGGWLGPADAPWPAAVVRARVPVWTWFRPEHATAGAMQSLSRAAPRRRRAWRSCRSRCPTRICRTPARARWRCASWATARSCRAASCRCPTPGAGSSSSSAMVCASIASSGSTASTWCSRCRSGHRCKATRCWRCCARATCGPTPRWRWATRGARPRSRRCVSRSTRTCSTRSRACRSATRATCSRRCSSRSGPPRRSCSRPTRTRSCRWADATSPTRSSVRSRRGSPRWRACRPRSSRRCATRR
ncbi:MAG: hypothetical protein U0168_09600 [Nannocystaceae bacterium]